MSNTNTIKIYTDGACSGNPGHAGAGAIIIYPDEKEYKLSTYLGNNLTNNIAELKAIQLSIQSIIHLKNDINLEIYTDSMYSINVLTEKWAAKKNTALIHTIKKLLSEFKNTRFIKVKAHSTIHYNNIADELATSAITYRNKNKIKEYI